MDQPVRARAQSSSGWSVVTPSTASSTARVKACPSGTGHAVTPNPRSRSCATPSTVSAAIPHSAVPAPAAAVHAAVSAAAGGWRVAEDEPGAGVRQLGPCGQQDLRVERGDHRPGGEIRIRQERRRQQRHGGHCLHLGLDADAHGRHHLGPRRHLLDATGVERTDLVDRQLRHRTRAVGRAVDRGVVQHHQPAVTGDAQVELDLVAACLHRVGERAQRVLRFAAHRTPVPGDDHGRNFSSYWRRTSSAIASSRRANDPNTARGSALSA
jgi:hypothetical protein